jgi:hypothetical protein
MTAMKAIVLAVTLLTAGAHVSPGHDAKTAWRGACYCRAAGELSCTANLTEAECDRRCREALCDDWFWRERLVCWNWGYGG